MQAAADRADARLAGLAALAVVELSFLRLPPWAAAPLILSLPLGALGFAPLPGKPGRLSALDPKGKPAPDDCLVAFEDVARCSHGELIHKLDRYLGGGITATQYYEDIVGRILLAARVAARKRRLLAWSSALVVLGQLLAVAAFALALARR